MVLVVIDNLVIDRAYKSNTEGMSIDMLLIDLSEDENEFEAIEIDADWVSVQRWQTNVHRYQVCILSSFGCSTTLLLVLSLSLYVI